MYQFFCRLIINMKRKGNEICKQKLPFDVYFKQSGYDKEPYRSLLKEQVKQSITTVDDIKHTLPYVRNENKFRTNLHLGQRKLCMNEVQFLTNFLKTKNDACYIVYAGAAPSNHIYILHELFPNVKFILVDPNTFVINIESRDITHYDIASENIVYLKKNVKTMNANLVLHEMEYKLEMTDFIKNTDYAYYLIEDFYTNELSELFTNLDDMPIYFWSDIRTSIDGKSASDFDITWNLSQQHNWVLLLKPVAFMLKFRCPYFEDIKDKDVKTILEKVDNTTFSFSKKNGIDFIDNLTKKKLIYFDGTMYIQPWGPVSTTEVRLVSNDYTKLKEYNCELSEQKFVYYNNIDRTFLKHDNKFADKYIGFDKCNDCTLEGTIWYNYIVKMKSIFPVNYYVKRLSNLLGYNLIQKGHGHLFDTPTLTLYKWIYEKYCYRKK